jgi:hypothetical protein
LVEVWPSPPSSRFAGTRLSQILGEGGTGKGGAGGEGRMRASLRV